MMRTSGRRVHRGVRAVVAVGAAGVLALAVGSATAPAAAGNTVTWPVGPSAAARAGVTHGSAAEGGSAPAAAGRRIQLITGDMVTVGAGGRDGVSVQPRDRAGLAGQFVGVRRGGQRYVFPAAALPYLGRGLDPALFDVTRLAAAAGTAAATAGHTPVRVSYRPGTAHRAIPGVTVTRTRGDTAEGYLTTASARAFGAALVARARADRAAGGQPTAGGGTAGLFGPEATVHPAGSVPAPADGSPDPTPPPPVDLRISVLGPNGKPAPQATILGLNTDDAFSAPIIEADNVAGELDLSLPPGNYGFIVAALDPATDVMRLVNVVDVAVGTQNDQTLTVDTRTALPISATTPRPSQLASTVVNLLRSDRNGAAVGIDVTTSDVQAIRLAPAPLARIGTLSYTADLQYVSAPGLPVPYAYNLAFGGQTGVPINLHFTVADGDLATVNENYHVEAGFTRQPAQAQMFSFLPWQDLTTTVEFPFTAPGRRIDYVTGRADAEWHASYFRDATDGAGHTVPGADRYADSARRYVAGQQVQADWGRAPVHPGVDTQTAGTTVNPFHCPVCREDDTMRIRLQPLNDAGNHFGANDGFIGNTVLGPRDTTGRQQLFAGDTLLDSGFGGNEQEVSVPAVSTRYRLVVDQNRIAPWVSTGVRSHTEWGFTSARPLQSTLPAGWRCGSIFEPPPNACAVVPLLVLGYTAPVDLTGTAPGGPQHLGVTVAPAQGSPATTITSVTVEVSFDDGATFTPATVTGSNGRYDAAFTAPVSGAVTTRLSATDSAGNTVTQTVTRAYLLGPAA